MRAPDPVRRLVDESRALPPAPPVVDYDVVYKRDGFRSQRLDIYEPLEKQTGPAPVVVFFHGGSWLHGDKVTIRVIDRFLTRMREKGFFVVSANYTTGIHRGIGGTVRNATDAVAWVAAHARAYGWDPHRIVLYGVSAGGHLALMATSRFTGPGATVSGVLAECAPTDLVAMRDGEAFDRSHMFRFFPERRLRALSPVSLVRPGFPPVLMLHGSVDETVHINQSRRLKSALEDVGVPVELYEYPDGDHAFLNLDDETWYEQESVALDWLDRLLLP